MAGRPPAGGQRQRLTGAMTVVAARHGYPDASVARVVKQAGMSRATFYEHFANRDECFLAAFRAASEPVLAELEAGGRAAAPAERPRAVLARALALAEANPAATRLVLIEACAGDARVRAERERLMDRIEAAIDGYLEAAAAVEAPIDVPARVLLGGVVSLVATRVFRREAGDLGGLLDDLLVWYRSYQRPGADGRLAAAEWRQLGRAWRQLHRQPPPARRDPRPLPRGRGALPAGQVASEHRERIVEAVASCVSERGYAATTVADLVAAAGVTRAAFYEQFSGKEDAFLAAQALGLERSAGLAAGRFFIDASWPDRVWSSGEALVSYIVDHPDLAYSSVVEAYAAGPAAVRRAFDSRMAYTLFLEDGYRQRPEAGALPRICSEAISGGMEELLRQQIVRGRIAATQEMVPPSVYAVLAPFIGAEAALELVRERCRRSA